MKLSVPANTSCTLYIPASSPDNVFEGGKGITAVEGIRYLRTEDGCVVCEVGSGDYSIESK
jgi:alpha-L-rhamnosidase